jgi:4-coumarate--CoA ligase
MEIHSPAGPLPLIPDDLTVPQFIFECKHPSRPARRPDIPWLIEDETGRRIGEHEVSVITANYLK